MRNHVHATWDKTSAPALPGHPLRNPLGRRLATALFSLFVILIAYQAQTQETNHPRIVAVADVHGAYQDLVTILQQTGIIDQDLNWSGGEDYLISLGDIIDRGADSRKVIDLLMRLQTEAAKAGGKTIVLLGNHEAMNTVGELDYVSDAEIEAFADDESASIRDAWFEAFRRNPSQRLVDEPASLDVFDATFQPGYFARLEAFSPEGQYGRWFLQLPIVVTVNDTLFVHGGLSPVMAVSPADSLNFQLSEQVRHYSDAWYALIRSGDLPIDAVSDRIAIAESIAADPQVSDETRKQAQQLIQANNKVALSPDSPFWYRGTALCYPLVESNTIRAVLTTQNAQRAVVGHTPTKSRRVETLRDGEIVMLDTGMLNSIYEGAAAALIIDGDGLQVAYLGDEGLSAPIASPRQVGRRPGNMSDDEIEEFLLTADIVDSKPIPVGVTAPQRLTLEKDGVRIDAVFKTLATDVSKGRGPGRNRAINNSDRWQYEIAAYRLDRLLGLDMVPVAVERNIDGKDGALIYFMPDLLSLLEKNQQGIRAEGYCPLQPQHDLMYVWDTLIYNEDRTLQNVTYTTPDWMLRLIDQSRSFRTYRDMPPYVRERELVMSQELADRLAGLNSEQLNETLGQYISRDQIRALLKRRDRLIEDWARIDGP